jgi:zinc protease
VTLHYGNEKSLQGITSATQFLGPLMVRGTKEHNRQQIQDELDKLKSRLTADGLIGDLTFRIETRRENLPAVLHLLREILRSPTLPADEFDILKRERRDALQKALTDPAQLAQRDVQRKLNPYPPEDVRYVPTVADSVARLELATVEQLRKIYEDQLGAQAGEVVVIGDFDPESTPKLLQDLFQDWKAKVPYERIARPARTEVKGERDSILTPDKENAVYMAGEMLPMKDTDPDYPSLRMASFVFGEGTLSSRLGNRVRQKEGLSYGVRSQFSADPKDPSARFLLFAICNPKVIERLDQVIAEELEKFLKEGPGDQELSEAKDAYLQQLKVQRANDGALAGMLEQLLYEGRTFAFVAEREQKIAALTPDQVATAFRKHIDPKRLVIVRAGDFNKK